MLYERMEPFGERGEYVRAAMFAAILVNAHRGAKSKPVTFDDFMPDTMRREPERKTGREAFLELARRLGARVT